MVERCGVFRFFVSFVVLVVVVVCVLPCGVAGQDLLCSNTTQVVAISLGLDDVEQQLAGPGDNPLDCEGEELLLGFSVNPRQVALLFRGLEIEDQEELVSAYLQVESTGTGSGVTSLFVRGIVTSDSAPFEEGCLGDLPSDRAREALSVLWGIPDVWEANTTKESPDVGNVVDGIRGTNGLGAGASLMLLVEMQPGNSNYRGVKSFESGSPPQLVLTWTQCVTVVTDSTEQSSGSTGESTTVDITSEVSSTSEVPFTSEVTTEDPSTSEVSQVLSSTSETQIAQPTTTSEDSSTSTSVTSMAQETTGATTDSPTSTDINPTEDTSMTSQSSQASSDLISSDEDGNLLGIVIGAIAVLVVLIAVIVICAGIAVFSRRSSGTDTSLSVIAGAGVFTSVKDVGISFEQNPAYRKTMEDEHVAIDKFGGKPDQSYFGVYDGHGGRKVAELVKANLHKNILSKMNEYLLPNQKMEQLLKDAYIETDKAILDECQPTKERAGSTAVSAVLIGGGEERWLYTANCGDARIVLCRGKKGVRLTVDHKATDEEEKERIQNCGGMIFMNKVAGTLAVTRAFGDYELKPWVVAEPYTKATKLSEEDTHLVLACDGLFDVAEDQQVADLITSEEDQSLSAQELSDKLLSYALANRSKDNISIIVVKL